LDGGEVCGIVPEGEWGEEGKWKDEGETCGDIVPEGESKAESACEDEVPEGEANN
jgi:hypothetical protein